MKKWNLIESTLTPDGKKLTLHEHDGQYSIRVNGLDLMSTREHSSEDFLAELGCRELSPSSRVLIGGLGFGFTLKKALKIVPPRTEIVVAELLETVILWNRELRFPFAREALQDPRVKLEHADVREVLKKYPRHFDAVLLDVDNGPSAFTVDQNESLYSKEGVQTIRNSLRAKGVIVFWSAFEDTRFERILASTGMKHSVHLCRSHDGKGSHHRIYLLEA